jgi:hypothetical protein
MYHLKCEDEHAKASEVQFAGLQSLLHDLYVLKILDILERLDR